MKTGATKKIIIAALVRTIIACVLMVCAACAATFAWWDLSGKEVASYVPIHAEDSLFIGAGHRDMENDTTEDIRYLYFGEMDANGDPYVDRVFCICGKGVQSYKIQLAYTTNNPFTYELYHATESLSSSAGAVLHTTHPGNVDYYYSINGAAIAGSYLNKTVENGKDIATSAKHTETYGSYSTANVQKNAEPIYWQTDSSERGSKNDFVNYYIIRVYKNGKATNDRETDVLCIAASAVGSGQ